MNDQIDELLDRFTKVSAGEDYDGPVMPFETALVLTREQEDKMMAHAMQRLEQLNSELGRDVSAADDWWLAGRSQEVQDAENTTRPEKTYLGKRKLYELTYENKVEWRSSVIGHIFEHSNLVIPLARRITRQMIARANNYFFGTDPWFAAYPVGQSDQETARKAMQYGMFKAKQAGSRALHETANEKAFLLGEAVVKSTHTTKETVYQTYSEVLVDAEGRPVMAADGDYITPDDAWVPVDEEGDQFVLKRDGQTAKMAVERYERKLVKRIMRQYHAPDQEVLHYMDFLCPLNAKSIDDADCCIHLYDMPVMDLADLWAKRGVMDLTADQSDEITMKAMEALRKLSSASGQGESSTSMVREELGEGQDSNQVLNSEATAEIAEVYLRYDANGDGLLEEIMLVVDVRNQLPIFYDYLANVTPDGRRPFRVNRINPVNGRWHGLGAMEMFESTQNIVDLLVNRWNFSQTAEARVDFWNPSCTEEGKVNPALKLNFGQTYTLLPGKKAEDALQSVYLQDAKSDHLQSLMEFFMQTAMNESGVQHANDSFVAGMDSQKLATGIRNIEKTGQEMFGLYLSHLEPGHTEILQAFFDLLFANMNPEEVITYFEDDSPDDLIQIAAGDVMDIELNVSILLTRQRGEEIMESSSRAEMLVNQFYSRPPEVRMLTAPLYVSMLRALNIPNAEKIINGEMPVPMVDNPGEQNPNELAAATNQGRELKADPNL